MKKRCLSLILSAALALSLCGCNATETMENIDELLEAVDAISNMQQAAQEEDAADVADNQEEKTEDAEEVETAKTESTESTGKSGIELVKELTSAGPYPTEADYSELYESIDAAKADCSRFVEIAKQLQDKYKGKLDNKESILDFYHDIIDSKVYSIDRRLVVYIEFITARNVRDEDAQKLRNVYNQASNNVGNSLAFADAEIMSLPLETRKEIFDSSDFDFIKHYVEKYTDPAEKIFDEDTKVVINKLRGNSDAVENTYYALSDDMGYVNITMPDGQEQELNPDLYSQILVEDYDHDFMKVVDDTYTRRYEKCINTLTNLLQTKMQNNVQDAAIRDFDTYLEYALHETGIEPEIYDNNIESVHNILPQYHRYIELKKKVLGAEDGVTYAELRKPIVSLGKTVEYDDAVNVVEEALTVYGDDYVKNFDTMLRQSHVDVYPADGKQSGGFEFDALDPAVMPYIHMNYRGDLSDVSTLAHEGGHAMYSDIAAKAPGANIYNASPGIFTQEIASTLNEYLLYRHLIDSTEDDELKLTYLDALLNMINSSVVTQTKYSEFEKYCYDQVESGEGFSAEEVCDYWYNLEKEYGGESYIESEGRRYYWAGVPHFYYGYYVYKYSTSATYSGIIVNRILNGDEEIVGKYLNMLALGDSMKPSDLLKTVDIDPTQEKVYSEFAEFYKGLMDEYEELLVSTGHLK